MYRKKKEPLQSESCGRTKQTELIKSDMTKGLASCMPKSIVKH